MKSAAPIPHLVVNDGVAAIQFYEATFGAVCNSKHLADDGKTPTQVGGTSVTTHLNQWPGR